MRIDDDLLKDLVAGGHVTEMERLMAVELMLSRPIIKMAHRRASYDRVMSEALARYDAAMR
jgi:hypothetical protein